MQSVEMRIANRVAEIDRIGEWADGFCAAHRLPSAVRSALRISLDEVLSNIISYAYVDTLEHLITVRLGLADRTLTVEIEDDGVPFDLTQAPVPDKTRELMEQEVGGLGIEFLRALNDQVSYRRDGGINRLVLRKNVGETSQAEKGGGMELLVHQSGTVSTVQPKGRIDSTNAGDFGERVCALIRTGSNRIVIDLNDIAYISSAGFRALLIAGKLIEETSGNLALCGISGEVKRLFDIAAFTDRFLILPTREDCIARLQQPS